MHNSSMLKVFSILSTPFPQFGSKKNNTEFLRLAPKVQSFKSKLIQSSLVVNESFMKYHDILFTHKRRLMFEYPPQKDIVAKM